jgi:tRNA (uracil-5-)-methyltransferase
MLCQTDPDQYAEQLASKQARLQSLLGELPQFECFASPPEHYRARAEFRVWHEGDRTDYIMFDPETKSKVPIHYCPMAIESIAELMHPLMEAIVADPVLRRKLFQVDFLATLSGEMLVTLIYRRPLQYPDRHGTLHTDPDWLQAAETLRERLPIDHIIGRARKQKVCLDQDFVTERLQVNDQAWSFQQIENSFTQPNPYMAQAMLAWAQAMAQQVNPQGEGDLLELYCGNGHFSIALAPFFRRVLATEISKTSVASAKINLEQNGVENLTVVRMAAEEISEALNGETFKRLKDVPLDEYRFTTLFLDPPRAGLDDLTRSMAAGFDWVIYISCNPETLARDLEVLKATHDVVNTALFDQFPYTHHIESGVLLQRKAP